MLRRFVSLILVIIILFLGTFVWLIRQPFFQEQLKTVITNYATQELKKNLKYKDLSLSIFGPALIATNVVLSSETEEMKVQNLKARVSLFSLLRGRFRLASVKGSKVEISLKKNWRPPSFDESFKGTSFKLPSLLFEDLSLKYERLDGDISLSQSNVYITQSRNDLFVVLMIPTLSFSLDKYERKNISLEGRFWADSKRISFEKFSIKERQNELNFNGRVFLSKKENFDI